VKLEKPSTHVASKQREDGSATTADLSRRPALNPVKGRGRVAQLYAALRPHPIILTKSLNFFPV